MKKTIVDYLEYTEKKYPNKMAYTDSNRNVTYNELLNNSKKIGSSLIKDSLNNPIVIYMDKTVSCLEAMMGVIYSGNFYAILDNHSPKERLDLIIDTLETKILITDKKNLKKATELVQDKNVEIFIYEEMIEKVVDEEKIERVRERIIDTNPMYILFTSGSTGVPKGTVLTHKAVISYVKWMKECFNINENTIFGSQTPFYFSMSISDVFSCMMSGATLHIIPKMLFSFPIKLLEFMKEKKINTIYWVPSALSIVANMGALDEIDLPDLNKILFAGEVMQVKQLNIWRNKFKNAMFANLYGPTETTDICTYYVLDRDFKPTETLPIGKHCNNCDVVIIKEDGTEAKFGEEGELCARGSFLASGYYKNPEKTEKAFVQNPLNKAYPEIIYKTGDIVKYNDKGEIIYISRKDFQIKHMGYRIELGEIENAINNSKGINTCACIYDSENDWIIAFYQGEATQEELLKEIKQKIPAYMVPNKVNKIDRMPYNANGKIDRKELSKWKN